MPLAVKGPLGAFRNRILRLPIRLSIRLLVRNSVPLTYKVQ